MHGLRWFLVFIHRKSDLMRGNEHMIGHLSSCGRKFHKCREGGKPGTEREEHPFLTGLR